MKDIIVTGGAGFVGSNLCDMLVSEGHNVFCIDNLSTGKLSNIKHLKDEKNFHFICCDIENMNLYFNSIDEIYNLACPASPPAYQKDGIKTIMTNVVGMKNMLELAYMYNAKIVQSSTSEVYGDPLETPQDESYWGNVNPFGFRSCYDEGKRCAEALCFNYMMQRNVDVRVVRIFNAYGKRMDVNDGRVISNFIVQALRNEPITVYGNGLQTRSPQYISDLIDGLMKAMNAPRGLINSPLNIGNPKEFSILDIAKLVKKLTGSKSEIVFKELPHDDPKRRKPSIIKANELLNWKPTVSLEEGLKRTIDYFMEEV